MRQICLRYLLQPLHLAELDEAVLYPAETRPYLLAIGGLINQISIKFSARGLEIVDVADAAVLAQVSLERLRVNYMQIVIAQQHDQIILNHGLRQGPELVLLLELQQSRRLV